MLFAQVVGNVWGAKQAENLKGYRLLVVRPLSARAREKGGGGTVHVSADRVGLETKDDLLVVVDCLGAGPGELVLVAHGTRCRDLVLDEKVPTKEIVVAIVDEAEVEVGEGRRA
ncbi:MAG: EutN/CcmL family microcompartment protein [Pseudomonadota bacterium]